jgi:ERF superfamily
MTYKGTLADALSRVMAGLGRIEKSGTAPQSMGGFRFVPETAVMNALQPLLVEEQIVLSPRAALLRLDDYETRNGAQMHLATVSVEMWARRGDEEVLWFTMIGQGADTQDKAIGKAITGAKKQGLLVAMSVPTGDDPDAAHTDAMTRRADSVEETRRRVSLSELRDKVLGLMQEADLPLAVLDTLLAEEGSVPFNDLDIAGLLALGERIKRRAYDLPTEPAADEREPDAPAMTPQPSTLDEILEATGGELVDDAAEAEAVPVTAGEGGRASPPGPAASPLDERIERARKRAGGQ